MSEQLADMNKFENKYVIKNGKVKRRQNQTPVLLINCSPLSLDNSPSINGKSKSSLQLTVLILNCQSLVAKRALFINLIVTHTPDIMICSESWLKSSIKDHEIFPAGYAAYHHDCADCYGGGIYCMP